MSVQTSTFTEVYFHHLEGGSILKNKTVSVNIRGPVLSAKSASPFRIVPLNDQDKPMQSSCWTISTKSKYYDTLKSEEWKNVAIQNEDGQYLSCRKKTPAGGALAEYRHEITSFEKFTVEYNENSKSFAFKSHNELYLHYNQYAQIIAFRDISNDKNGAGWIINPFHLQDPSNEKIKFVGVLNHEGEFFMQRNCILGSKAPWGSQIEFKTLVQMLSSNMSVAKGQGSCTIFESEQNTWYVTMTKEKVLNIAVTTLDCPHYIGATCVEEVETVFDKSESMDHDKELENLMVDISNQYQFAMTGTLKEKFKSYDEKMKENITRLQEDLEHAEDLIARCNELKHIGRKCHDKFMQLPGNKWTRGAKKAPDVLVKGMANLAGNFAGTKFASKVLKDKASLVVDVTSNFDLEKNGPIYKFWTRRFITFGEKIGEIEIDFSAGKEQNVTGVPPLPTAVAPPVPSAPPLPGVNHTN